MVVIAALIGAGGLGLTVYVALGRLDIGAVVIGGTGIVTSYCNRQNNSKNCSTR